MRMLANCKNGVSSHEIHLTIGVTQKSAWFMLHRIRQVMKEDDIMHLSGEVEMDETFVGGGRRTPILRWPFISELNTSTIYGNRDTQTNGLIANCKNHNFM